MGERGRRPRRVPVPAGRRGGRSPTTRRRPGHALALRRVVDGRRRRRPLPCLAEGRLTANRLAGDPAPALTVQARELLELLSGRNGRHRHGLPDARPRTAFYLGGWATAPQSKHLRSRHETALALAEQGPPLTYLRAGMVVGAQTESYRTLRYLVQRLPAMIAPAWLKSATQPIAIDDTLRYLVQDRRSWPRAAGKFRSSVRTF